MATMARVASLAAALLLCAALGGDGPRFVAAQNCRNVFFPAAEARVVVRDARSRSRGQPRPKAPKRGKASSSPYPTNDADGRLDRSDRRVMPWVSVAILVVVLFFFRSFAAPFFDPLGEPRQATASSVYFSFIAFIYIWLVSVTTITALPQLSTNYNIIIATALFFYMVFVSICALLFGRFCVRGGYYAWLVWKNSSFGGHSLEEKIAVVISSTARLLGEGMNAQEQKDVRVNGTDDKEASSHSNKHAFPDLIAFHRPLRRVVKSALIVSAALCIIYSHCWSRSLSAFNLSGKFGANVVCRAIFLPTLPFSSSTECHSSSSCAEERSIWILWAAAVILQLSSYVMNEFAGRHHTDFRVRNFMRKGAVEAETVESRSSSSYDLDLAEEDVDENDDDHDKSFEEGEEGRMGPWQSISDTIQTLRTRKPEQPQGTLPMVSWYSHIVLSTGFDMLISLKVFLGRFDARKMQVALLKETRTEADRIRNKASDEGVFDFSQCSQYSHVNESGFWFDFMSDCGDGFNSSYQVARCLAQPTLNIGSRILPRGKLLINGGDLAYPDPTPDNYEKRFFRTFEDAMPPPPSFRREHISIRKPALPVKGWKMDKERSELSSYPGPCAFLIPGNHDWFDGLSTFTRYILSRDWLGGWLMPQRTSYFALTLPKNWWLLGLDLALDDDIDIEQFQFFANVAEKSMKPNDSVIIVSHKPNWVLNEYDNHHNDSSTESNLSELIRTHLRGRVKLRLAGDLHHYTRHVPVNNQRPVRGQAGEQNAAEKPMLIVSGGGGAFLHPTHCFQDRIEVGEEKQEYARVCAFPSTKVSRNLSWLNLWQFRWRNWRLDVLWAITHFGVCSSFFPLCGVYEDYVRFTSNHIGYLPLWVFRRVMALITHIFLSGRASLVFTLIVVGFTYGFTDSSNLKWQTHLGWSFAHGFAHIASALACMLFVECLAEFVMNEGLVETQNTPDNAGDATCGTGLANSLYDEYTEHFSHTLEDFQLLNATNSTTHEPPDIFPSCRFDETLYEMVSSTLSWLYHEAPFLKRTVAIFDLPGVIGSTHAEMCEILCSDGTECTFSNDFLRYQQLGRVTIMKYLASISLYYVVFAVPIAGNIFGTWLSISLNYLNCQYDEGFSSLRMEHWKNFLKLHIDEKGDLEIFAIGLPRVPKKWRKDPSWEGEDPRRGDSTEPSWMWKSPSKWKEWRSRVKFSPQMVDYTKIKGAAGQDC